MPRKMQIDDFRAVRRVLEKEDFATGGDEIDRSPTDLIDEDTWIGITQLPDDVSIRTSDHNGTKLKQLYEIYGAWTELSGNNNDPLYDCIIDGTDEFQAAVFNSLCGYYRQALGCLRNILEKLTIGASFALSGKKKAYHNWQSGKMESSFGYSCDLLSKLPKMDPFKRDLAKQAKDSLFNKRKNRRRAGWARRMYAELSDYAHSRPGYESGNLWQSNGPVYNSDAFDLTYKRILEVSAYSFILVMLVRKGFELPEGAKSLFETDVIKNLEIAAKSYEFVSKNQK